MKDLQVIADAIKKEEDLAVVGHAVPDGDCVGSVLDSFWDSSSWVKMLRLICPTGYRLSTTTYMDQIRFRCRVSPCPQALR